MSRVLDIIAGGIGSSTTSSSSPAMASYYSLFNEENLFSPTSVPPFQYPPSVVSQVNSGPPPHTMTQLPSSASRPPLSLATLTTPGVLPTQSPPGVMSLSGVGGGQTSPSGGTGSSGSFGSGATGPGFPGPVGGAAGGDSRGSAGSSSGSPPIFDCPRRPNIGTEGRPILLRANHFPITMPRGFLHHYDVTITPDKCPRKINREIVETMVQSYSKIFIGQRPVFDGRKNMFTRDDLPIGRDKIELEVTLPGEVRLRMNILRMRSDIHCIFCVGQRSSLPSCHKMGQSGQPEPFGGSTGRFTAPNSSRCNPGLGCRSSTSSFHGIHSGWTFILQCSRWLLPSSWRRKRSLVWISPVSSPISMENDT